MSNTKMWQIIAAAICLLVVPLMVSADVTVKQKTSAAIAGGVLKSSGTITTMISGDKERNDSEMKTKVLISSPTVKTIDIMRLDKEVVWNLDPKKQTYTEMTFAEMRAMMDSASAQMQAMAQESKERKHDEDVEVSPPQFKVERTGNKATIAGYACEEAVMTVITKTKDKKTGDTGTFTLQDRMWVTRDWAGQNEYEAFSTKMAAKMGFGRGMESTQSYLAMMGLDAEDLYREMAKVGGFPMKQEMSMFAFGGPGTQKAEAKEKSGETEESANPADKLKKLGLFGKKKDKEKEEKSKEAGPPPGALFSMTVEVESVTSGSVDGSQFEVPAGYKKVEKKK